MQGPRHCTRLAAQVLLAWLVGSLPVAAETHVVGPDGLPAAFADALRRARDGDVIDMLPGEYRGVVGVIGQKKLTIRGVGARPVFLADGKVAEGKAILVVRNGDIVLDNLEFRGARAADANGAGVRFEKGRLQVRRCAFLDNQMGLLTANFGDAELDIVDSEFGLAPESAGGLTHLLYVGRIGRFSVRGSHFHRGASGHLIKSRARESFIAYNMVRDGPAGRASYEVDLPNGGVATLVGNVIAQSAGSDNPVVVSFGEEGRGWERNALYMVHNTLINEGWKPAWFLRVDRDKVPNIASVRAVNNLLVGLGTFSLPNAVDFAGNWPATPGMLRDAATLAFELPPESWLRGRGVNPRDLVAAELLPQAEFEWPVGTVPIGLDRAAWSPGAYQR